MKPLIKCKYNMNNFFKNNFLKKQMKKMNKQNKFTSKMIINSYNLLNHNIFPSFYKKSNKILFSNFLKTVN